VHDQAAKGSSCRRVQAGKLEIEVVGEVGVIELPVTLLAPEGRSNAEAARRGRCGRQRRWQRTGRRPKLLEALQPSRDTRNWSTGGAGGGGGVSDSDSDRRWKSWEARMQSEWQCGGETGWPNEILHTSDAASQIYHYHKVSSTA
jgi:hypothetical protein